MPGRRHVQCCEPARAAKVLPIIFNEMRTRAPPGACSHERTAAQACALTTTRLGSSHTVRAVEGGPRVPPLPPQVPRMAEIDVSVAIATFLLFFESLEVRGPPI